MNGVLPIALLGVAAFFVYRYYSSPADSTPAAGGSTPAGGGGSGSSTHPATGGGSSTVPAGSGSSAGSGSGSSTSTPSTQQLSQSEILQGAAIGLPDLVAAADQRNWTLNVDQWNWYREQAGAEPIDASYMPSLIGSGERGALITASEYRRRLASNGLGYGGMGYLISAESHLYERWR